jgi:hypothetical protein
MRRVVLNNQVGDPARNNTEQPFAAFRLGEWPEHPPGNYAADEHYSSNGKWMALTHARCRLHNPRTKHKMPAKKKPQATKLKVVLKDLKPRKDLKGGALSPNEAGRTLTQKYCSGVIG